MTNSRSSSARCAVETTASRGRPSAACSMRSTSSGSPLRQALERRRRQQVVERHHQGLAILARERRLERQRADLVERRIGDGRDQALRATGSCRRATRSRRRSRGRPPAATAAGRRRRARGRAARRRSTGSRRAGPPPRRRTAPRAPSSDCRMFERHAGRSSRACRRPRRGSRAARRRRPAPSPQSARPFVHAAAASAAACSTSLPSRRAASGVDPGLERGGVRACRRAAAGSRGRPSGRSRSRARPGAAAPPPARSRGRSCPSPSCRRSGRGSAGPPGPAPAWRRARPSSDRPACRDRAQSLMPPPRSFAAVAPSRSRSIAASRVGPRVSSPEVAASRRARRRPKSFQSTPLRPRRRRHARCTGVRRTVPSEGWGAVGRTT